MGVFATRAIGRAEGIAFEDPWCLAVRRPTTAAVAKSTSRLELTHAAERNELAWRLVREMAERTTPARLTLAHLTTERRWSTRVCIAAKSSDLAVAAAACDGESAPAEEKSGTDTAAVPVVEMLFDGPEHHEKAAATADDGAPAWTLGPTDVRVATEIARATSRTVHEVAGFYAFALTYGVETRAPLSRTFDAYGVYAETVSRLNHSCRPNTYVMFAPDHRAVLIALRPIDAGEELTRAYDPFAMELSEYIVAQVADADADGTAATEMALDMRRYRHLQNACFGMRCTCERCQSDLLRASAKFARARALVGAPSASAADIQAAYDGMPREYCLWRVLRAMDADALTYTDDRILIMRQQKKALDAAGAAELARLLALRDAKQTPPAGRGVLNLFTPAYDSYAAYMMHGSNTDVVAVLQSADVAWRRLLPYVLVKTTTTTTTTTTVIDEVVWRQAMDFLRAFLWCSGEQAFVILTRTTYKAIDEPRQALAQQFAKASSASAHAFDTLVTSQLAHLAGVPSEPRLQALHCALPSKARETIACAITLRDFLAAARLTPVDQLATLMVRMRAIETQEAVDADAGDASTDSMEARKAHDMQTARVTREARARVLLRIHTAVCAAWNASQSTGRELQRHQTLCMIAAVLASVSQYARYFVEHLDGALRDALHRHAYDICQTLHNEACNGGETRYKWADGAEAFALIFPDVALQTATFADAAEEAAARTNADELASAPLARLFAPGTAAEC
jgi:hypothetical protein